MIKLIKYSEKSIILSGEKTKDIKTELRKLNGRFNRFLTDPSTKEKISGWVFHIRKEQEIIDILNNLNIEFSKY